MPGSKKRIINDEQSQQGTRPGAQDTVNLLSSIRSQINIILRDLDRYLTAAVCLSLAVNWELPVDGWMKLIKLMISPRKR